MAWWSGTIGAAWLLASCQAGLGRPEAAVFPARLASARPGEPAGADPAKPAWAGAATVQADRRVIRGRADFPAVQTSRSVQVSPAEVSREATVALLDTVSGDTLAGGRTDAAGRFALAPNLSFYPVKDGFYHLQVSRSSGAAIGSNQVSMATVLRWTGGGWASITNGSAGAGEIVVNPTTTAVALLQAADSATPFAQIMGVVSGTGYTAVTAFGSFGAAEVTAMAALVATRLGQGLDPVGSGLTQGQAQTAPDDPGNPAEHHDYQVTENGVTSVFVWVPAFTAYQLVNPANCGGTNASKPAGFWVKDKPGSGTQDRDWVMERFGGFYAAKFEASRADAAQGAAGTGTRGTWSGDTNLTTHTGTKAGVYDLNGNVWEWTASLGSASTSGNYVLADVDTGVSVGSGNISALSTDARLRRYGLPGATGGETILLGRDYFEMFTTSPNKPQRGGAWGWGPSAGVWTLVLTNPRGTTSGAIGFRPALRF